MNRPFLPRTFVVLLCLAPLLTAAADEPEMALFHLRNGRTRKAFFLSLRNDTVTIGVRQRDGTKKKMYLPRGHFIKIEFRDGMTVDLDKPTWTRPPKYGTLKVQSLTFPGQVRIDGMGVGSTPYQNAGMLPGDYTLEVTGRGIVPVKEPIVIRAGETLTRIYDLEHTKEWLAAQEAAKDDSLKAIAMARRDSLEALARAKENEAFRPENVQADLEGMFARLAPGSPAAGPAVVAVVPFAVKGAAVPADAGTLAAEYGVVFYSRRPGYTVVERAKAAGLAADAVQPQDGLVPAAASIEAVRATGASLMVTGSVGEAMGRRLVSARMVDLGSGEVVSAAVAGMTAKQMSAFYRDSLGQAFSGGGSALRSMLAPGWGQFHSGHPGHGTVSLVAFVGSAAVLGWAGYEYLDTRDDDNTLRVQICAGVTAGVWALNILDAAIVGGAGSRNARERYFSVAPQAGRGIDGTAVGLSLCVQPRRR